MGKKIKTILLFVVLIISCLLTTSCGKNEDTKNLKESAENGNKEAQLKIAKYYSNGSNGFQKNQQEAFKWCEMSAKQGYSPAELTLSLYYDRATGVGQDKNEAKKWLKKGLKDTGFFQGYWFCILEILNYEDAFDVKLWTIWKLISFIAWIFFWGKIKEINTIVSVFVSISFLQNKFGIKNNNNETFEETCKKLDEKLKEISQDSSAESAELKEEIDAFATVSKGTISIINFLLFIIYTLVINLPCYLWFRFWA